MVVDLPLVKAVSGSRTTSTRQGSVPRLVSSRFNSTSGVQLVVLNVVTDESLEKGQRYQTFAHTEYALVSTFDLSEHINQNIKNIWYAYICFTTLRISENYTKVNESIVGWLNGL